MNKRLMMIAALVMVVVGLGGFVPPAPTIRAQADCEGQPSPRLNINSVALVVGDDPLPTLRDPNFPRSFEAIQPGTVVRVLDKPLCYEGRYLIHVAGSGLIGWVNEVNAAGDYLLEPSSVDLSTDVLFVRQTQITTLDLSFAYDTALGDRVLVQRRNADELVVVFLDYPTTFIQGLNMLSVFPTDNYTGAFPAAAAERLPQLLTIFSERPTLATTTTEDLPVLPAFSSAQEFVARAAYVDGIDFSGFRFVTRYTQATVPLVGDDLQVVVQGLADGGALYVYAFWPLQTVAPLSLPDYEETVGYGDLEEIMPAYSAYLMLGASQIDLLPADAFTPTLSSLDAILTSLDVTITRAELPFANTPNFVCGAGGTAFYRGQAVTVAASTLSADPREAVGDVTFDAAAPVALVGPSCIGGAVWWQVEQGTLEGWTPESALQP